MNISSTIREHIEIVSQLERVIPDIERAGELMISCLHSQGKVLWMGNGGSAAECQHLSAELIGHYMIKRSPIPSIALTTDTSVLTAISNDYSFANVFSRQIKALCQPQDVVIGLTTSGNSKNIILGFLETKDIGAHSIALLGGEGGDEIIDNVDIAIRVPFHSTPRIQEAHLLIGHILCEMMDNEVKELY